MAVGHCAGAQAVAENTGSPTLPTEHRTQLRYPAHSLYGRTTPPFKFILLGDHPQASYMRQQVA